MNYFKNFDKKHNWASHSLKMAGKLSIERPKNGCKNSL
jgi:hypothetical protein